MSSESDEANEGRTTGDCGWRNGRWGETGEKEANDLREPSGCSITFLTKIAVVCYSVSESTISLIRK